MKRSLSLVASGILLSLSSYSFVSVAEVVPVPSNDSYRKGVITNPNDISSQGGTYPDPNKINATIYGVDITAKADGSRNSFQGKAFESVSNAFFGRNLRNGSSGNSDQAANGRSGRYNTILGNNISALQAGSKDGEKMGKLLW